MCGDFQSALTLIIQFLSTEMAMLNFPMVNSAVPGPLLLPPALCHPWQGSTEPEQGAREEGSCWVSQGCVDMASPALAIQVFLTSLYLKPQSKVCCDSFPGPAHSVQKQSCSLFNLLLNYRLCGPGATALVLLNLHRRDKVPAVKTLPWLWELSRAPRGPAGFGEGLSPGK